MQESVEDAVKVRGRADRTLAEELLAKVSASHFLVNLSCYGTKSSFYDVYACHLQVSVNCV